MDLFLSDADLVCKENPWPWTPGFGRVYHYKGGPNGSLTAMGFLKDETGDTIDIGDCSIPIIIDWNSDGLLDLVLGTYGPHDASNALFYEWRVYINKGTAQEYRFNTWETIVDGDGNPILASTLVIRDLDRDGKKDIIFSYNNEVRFAWYRNVGSTSEPLFEGYESLPLPPEVPLDFSYYDLADITGDGVLDLVFVNMYYPKYSKGVMATPSVQNGHVQKNNRATITNQSGELTVKLNNSVEVVPIVTLFDIRGRVVLETHMEKGFLHIANLHTGWYSVMITLQDISETHSVTLY